MQLEDAIRRRRMVRAFRADPLEPDDVGHVLDLARRAPSAGNTAAIEFLVLQTPAETAAYWDTTLPAPRRQRFAFPGLLRAPVLVILTTRPDAYPERYAESDKERSGLGASTADWPVPYWWVDAGAVAQNLLLLATERDWGACLFGLFEHEPALARRFGIPENRRCVATVALGHPSSTPERPGRSANRPRPAAGDIIHRGRWERDEGSEGSEGSEERIQFGR